METGVIWTRRRALAALVAGATALVGAAPVFAQDTVRVAETAAGDAAADAIRALTGADLAFVPASAFRPGADARTVSAAEAAALIGTSTDTVVVMNLTGKQVLDALERSVSYAPKPFAGFLQVSGIDVRFSRKPASGARIVSVRRAGKAIDPATRYKVAMPRPLADGQLGYFQIWTKEQIALDTGKTMGDALAKARAVVQVDGRITGTDE